MVRIMYPPAEFSPDAYLAQTLTIGETTSAVLTTTAWLPAGPNIFILNDAAGPEIVRYESNNVLTSTLSGLTRELSVNGTLGAAREHLAGTACYRGDTAYDDAGFIENISYLFGSHVIGIEWDRNASDTTALKWIDLAGNEISTLPFTSFDNHATFRLIRRCVLSGGGRPRYGSNARGDGLSMTGSDGRVMVSYPKVYVRSDNPSAGVYRFWISPFPISGFAVFPGFLQRGGVERDHIFVGAKQSCITTKDYPNHVSTTLTLNSITGAQPATGINYRTVAFTSGGVATPTIGYVLKGATSAATATIADWNVSGAWSGGEAAGTFILRGVSGTFVAENLDLYQADGTTLVQSNVCTIAAAPVTTSTGMSISNARTLATNIGPGWGLTNAYTMGLIRLLMAIEYKTWNLQVGLGRGIVDLAAGSGFAGLLTGYGSADVSPQIGTNGTGKGIGTDGTTTIVWRGLENPWGNVATFVDGIAYGASTETVTVITPTGVGTPSSSVTSGPWDIATVDMPTSTGYASDLLYDYVTRYLLLPGSTTGGTASTYLCDQLTIDNNTGLHALLHGGAWDAGSAAGLNACITEYDTANAIGNGFGARLERVGDAGTMEGVAVSTSFTAVGYARPYTDGTVPTDPGFAFDDASLGTLAWDHPLRILKQDGSPAYATSVTATGTQTTHYLKATAYGFNIPPTATITMVAVTGYTVVVNNDASNEVRTAQIHLIKPDGTLSSGVSGETGLWSGTIWAPGRSVFISTTPTGWGWAGLTPADINHGGFGVAVAATLTNPSFGSAVLKAGVDYIGIEVTYTI